MCQCPIGNILCKFSFLVHLLIKLTTLNSWSEAINCLMLSISHYYILTCIGKDIVFLGGDVLLLKVENC